MVPVNAVWQGPVPIIGPNKTAGSSIFGTALGTCFSQQFPTVVLALGKFGDGRLWRITGHDSDDQTGLLLGRCLTNLPATGQHHVIQMRRQVNCVIKSFDAFHLYLLQ
jgi:hypothetical protein